MAALSIAFVIPAFNEDATIESVVRSLIPFGEVLVVDDGSDDNTALKAATAGAHIVQHTSNLGYDKALNSGFCEAALMDVNVIFSFDADGQHKASAISSFRELILDGADVVIGVRDQKGRVSEEVFSWLSQKVWNIQDPFCGMKAYKTEVYKALGHFDSYGSIGTELSLFAVKMGFNIAEVPIMIKRRQDQSRLGSSLIANGKIIRAILFGLFNRKVGGF